MKFATSFAVLVGFVSLALFLAAFAYGAPAFAADAASASAPVGIHWGAWLSQIATLLTPVIVGVGVGLAHQFITGPLALFVSDGAIENAVRTIIAKEEDVIAGQSVSVPVANALAQKILSYLVVQEPAVVKTFGPKLGDVILAKLSAAGVLPASGVVAPKA